jgi:predicted transcriptional regulator
MASRHGDDKLLAAWSDPDFVDAIDALARIAGTSRSVLIRAALAQMALDVPVRDAATDAGRRSE